MTPALGSLVREAQGPLWVVCDQQRGGKDSNPDCACEPKGVSQEVKGVKDLGHDGTEDQIQCRICWSSEEDVNNPLIIACKCKGTVGLIHFQCLKNWVLTQKQEKPPNA